MLLGVRELSGGRISILSGQRLDVDADRRLLGECDFILAVSEPLPRLRAPLVTIVEALLEWVAGEGPMSTGAGLAAAAGVAWPPGAFAASEDSGARSLGTAIG